MIATAIAPLRETLGDAAFFYPPAAGDQLASLAEAAYRGWLGNRASSFMPPSWSRSGGLLMAALSRALAAPGDPPAAGDPGGYNAAHARRMPA